MRDLIVSIVIIVVLISGWIVFDNYSENQLAGFATSIKEDIIPAVEGENREDSKAMIEELNKLWHKYRSKALLFLETSEINEIDYCLAKSEKYIKAEDVSNSSGELNSLAEQLIFMYEQEKINLANIL